jgi:H+/Cl- antiporter ClcA
MGGGIAALLIRVIQIPASLQQTLLVAGVSAGFAAIFGTPLAGAMFALEVATPRRPMWRHLPLALGSAFLADWIARMWGITHVAYTIPMPDWQQWSQLPMLAGLGVAALAFGVAGKMFVRMHHGILALQEKGQIVWWLPPFLGGCLLVALSQLRGTSDYLGLGTWSLNPAAVTLSSAFSEHGALAWSWLAKLTLTALSLGSGFKGGEVTPLFFTGATLGNVIAGPLGLPVPLCAGLGFVAVFAGAAHTPLTGALLAAELFGWSAFPLFLANCWLADWTCGRAGLYASQER